MNRKTIFIVLLISLFSLFLNVYKKNQVPACLNADEASFAYNAYSIAKTGRDEYGVSFPLRLKSFGDYKMPLYTYLSVPFVSVFGLSESSSRMLNTVLVFFLPFVAFFLVREFFIKEEVALLTSFLVAVSLGLHIVGRQAHEAYLALFLIALSALFFIKILKKSNLIYGFLFLFSLFLSLFAYQSSRVFAVFFFLFASIYFSFKKSTRLLFAGFTAVLLIFLLTDLLYQPERLKNLIFFRSQGFSTRLTELRAEGGSRVFYNKVTLGARELTSEFLKYFSPQFLAISGDENYRFGFPGMSLLTPVEYLFIFVGLYYLFKNKEKWRYFLIGLFLVSPLPASLSWAGASLTRSLFIFIPVLIIISYGIVNFTTAIAKNPYGKKIFTIVLVAELFFLFYSWDFYFHHYPKKAVVVRSWQCGYKEVADFVKEKYEKFDRFYISKEHGQPYIFLLFYLKYSPDAYQKQARLSRLDQYGFGQVERFDKFIFSIPSDKRVTRAALIAYPHDFEELKQHTVMEKIKIENEEIFFISENP